MLSMINEAIRYLQFRVQNEKGQALAEYGLILALIAVVCIVALGVIGLAIAGHLGFIGDELGGAPVAPPAE